jgi:uncharacterized protein
MTALDLLIICAAAAGAAAQTGLGVGFSLLVAPPLMMSLGAKEAVPVLLALNIIVSLVGLFGVKRGDLRDLALPLLGSGLGVALGGVAFSWFSERMVLGLTGALLILGGAARVRAGGEVNGRLATAAGAIAGVATAWTATPGPVAALGLGLSGHGGERLRRILQPFSLVSYSLAFALSGPSSWTLAATIEPNVLLAVFVGAAAGLAIGGRLPGALIVAAIRVLALAAGTLLVARALSI